MQKCPLLARVIFIFTLSLLQACSLLSQSQNSAPDTFTLQVENTRPVRSRATGPVLLVSTPDANHGLRTTQIAYTQRPYEIKYYARHAWVEPPVRLLQAALVQAMERAGLFASVTTPASGVVADLSLETQLLALQQEFTGNTSRGRVALRAQLVDLNTRKVLASRDLEASEPVNTPDPYGGVTAINRALAKVLDDLLGFLDTAIRARRTP